MNTLEQTIASMEQAYKETARNGLEYEESLAYREFLELKASDLQTFKSLVSHFGCNTNIKEVLMYLYGIGADIRYISMAKNPLKYFQATEKLKTLMMFGY